VSLIDACNKKGTRYFHSESKGSLKGASSSNPRTSVAMDNPNGIVLKLILINHA